MDANTYNSIVIGYAKRYKGLQRNKMMNLHTTLLNMLTVTETLYKMTKSQETFQCMVQTQITKLI